MELINFSEAMESVGKAKKHLLLGNGFSVDLKPDIFSYSALVSKANFVVDSTIEKIFKILGTSDFEVAVQAIENAAMITPLYGGASDSLIAGMRNDAKTIKDKLIELVIETHPDRPNDVTDAQRDNCITFLKHFDGKVFTLNYDILLYWVLMNAKERNLLSFDDGFRTDVVAPDASYVVWDNGDSFYQNVHYIHGALHLFDAKHQLRKYTWKRTDIPLIEQARSAISDGFFPLFVSEGTWEKKMEKITHSGYLHKAYRSLCSNSGTIFVHGFSMSPNDEHITRAIEKKYSRVFVGIHGNKDSDSNRKTIERALAMTNKKLGLSVIFYKSESAKVWRN